MIELACRSKECAPPPVGRGGSLPGTGRDPVWGTPPEPGSAALEPGEFLAYHHTSSDEALSSILREGVKLDTSERRPTEEAAAVWGSFERPQHGKRYVEFKVRYEDLYIGQPEGPEGMEGAAARGSNFTMAEGEIPVDRITTWSDQGIEDVRVWQRELADADEAWKKSVLNGAYDGVPAVDKAKQVLAKEFGSPGWAEKPSGVTDGAAIKRVSVPRVDTDRLERRADRLRREIDDPDFVYPGARMGFRHRAAELTAIESELVKRGALEPEARRTSVVAALVPLVVELAGCQSAACAPPPVGVGGSQPLAGGSRARQVVIDTIEEIGEGSVESLKFGRQMLLARQKVRGFHQLSSMNADLDPAMEAEYGALSKAVPVQEGFVRDGSEAAAELQARIEDVLPSAQVGWMDDVHAESVNALLDGVALYPEEVRAYVKGVALGYTEAESHVAAFGPHGGGLMGPDAPGATLWLGPKAVRPSTGTANPDGASVMTTVDGFDRHRMVGAHEMAHAVHNMAAQRAWEQDARRIDLRSDPLLPEGVPTTRYGGLDTGELVAETFALAARDTFAGLEPLQQDLIVGVLDRAGLRPEQLDFAAEEREPYEVQFFGDDFGLEPDALRAAGCQSADCAPPPVGTGGSKPGSARVAELDSERIQAVQDEIYEAYGEIWDDIPDVIDRAYRIQTALNARTWEGAKVEDAYQAAVMVVDGDGEEVEHYVGLRRDGWHDGLRSVFSATMKSPEPDADVQALLVRMHEATQQVFQDHLLGYVELARSFDPVTDAADAMTGNERATSLYGSRKSVDTIPSSGVTSWAAYTADAGDWGSEYVEQRFPIEQVLMREGSIDGEFLVGESVERVREIVGR